jgi:hypothetical protein
MERRRGPMAPSTNKLAGQGKGMRASPTHGGVAWPKAAVAVVQGRGSGGGGANHNGDRDSGGVGRQLHEGMQESDR